MRILIVHNEAQFFGGAEKMLAYFAAGMAKADCEVVYAVTPGSRVDNSLPKGSRLSLISDSTRFSLGNLYCQVRALKGFRDQFQFDVIHAWAARGWEVASLLGRVTRKPVLATLHDHPQAGYITAKRRLLMKWSARYGVRQVVAVSEAVRQACLSAGYPQNRLAVVRNGLPPLGETFVRPPASRLVRLGFLGAFSEGKGLAGLFRMLEGLAAQGHNDWEIYMGGGAPDDVSKQFLDRICEEHGTSAWWQRVHWAGWINEPLRFLASIDLLIFPSQMFDSFPNVLLEAGLVGTPVLAARVGGVPEIIEPDRTGWLFEPGNWLEATTKLANALRNPVELMKVGHQHQERTQRVFSLDKMVADYMKLYSTLCAYVK
jgi:glycosyltransferase involved in cell wall biosynthesis